MGARKVSKEVEEFPSPRSQKSSPSASPLSPQRRQLPRVQERPNEQQQTQRHVPAQFTKKLAPGKGSRKGRPAPVAWSENSAEWSPPRPSSHWSSRQHRNLSPRC